MNSTKFLSYLYIMILFYILETRHELALSVLCVYFKTDQPSY